MIGNRLRNGLTGLGLALALAWPASASAQRLHGSGEASNLALDAVVVTAGGKEEHKREVTTNITIIGEKEIGRSTARDLAGLLAQNGLQTYQTGGTATLYIRGVGGSSMQGELDARCLILLNGHRVGANDLSLLNLGNVERVEIIRGPAALQYGPEVGGVVNVITRRGSEDFTARAELGLGSFGRSDQKLSFSGAVSGFDFAAAVARTQRDDLRTGSGERWRHTNDDGRLGLDLDAGYTFGENHRLGAHIYYARLDGNEVPGSGFSDTFLYPGNYAVNDNDLLNTTLSYSGATADQLWSWSAEYTHGQNENKSYSFRTLENYYYGPPYWPLRGGTWDTEMEMNQAKAQVGFDNRLLALTLGLDWLDYDYSSVSGSYDAAGRHFPGQPTGQKVEDRAVWLLAKLRLLEESLIFSAGGRYDSYKSASSQVNFSRTQDHFSPSLGVAWLPWEFLKLRANYSEGFRLPSPSAVLGNGTTTLPNFDLKPEESKNFEIGADLSWEFVEANLTWFRTSYENRIASTGSWPGPYQNRNLEAKSTYGGLEFGLSADLGRAFDWDFKLSPYVNVTWMLERRNRDRTSFVPQDRDTLPYVPEVTASYGLTFEHPGINLEANLNASYMGRHWSQDWSYMRPAAPATTTFIDHGGFTVVDLSLSKRLWDFEDKGHLSLRTEINNLFDKDYALVLDYPQPGRNFYVGLVYEY